MQDLPIIILATFPLDRLEKEYLMIQVLDYDYATADDTLGMVSKWSICYQFKSSERKK